MGPCNPTLSIDFDQVGNEVHVDMIVEIFLHIIEIWMYWIFGSSCEWLFLVGSGCGLCHWSICGVYLVVGCSTLLK